MEQVFEALCNSLYLILEAISKFDVTQLDNTKFLMASQFIADSVRLLIIFINIFVR